MGRYMRVNGGTNRMCSVSEVRYPRSGCERASVVAGDRIAVSLRVG